MPMTQIIKVKNKFINDIEELISIHKKLMSTVTGLVNQASFETMLAKQFVLLLSIQWESFVDDLLVAYVVTNPTVFYKNTKQKIKKSNNDKFGSSLANRIKFVAPRPLSDMMARTFLDPKGWNIGPTDARKLADFANANLSAKYARRFSLDADDTTFLQFLRAIRNYLSHQNKSSFRILKEAINNMTASGGNADLKGIGNHVGVYLKCTVSAGDTRAILIADRISQIVAKLTQ